MRNTIASTFGLDVSELADYRYQPTRTTRPIYAIGDIYVASGLKPPKDDVGEPWKEHSDQFWAKGKTKVWVSKAINKGKTSSNLSDHAPNLLMALEGLLEDITEYQTINNINGQNNHWQILARKTIAEAKRG